MRHTVTRQALLVGLRLALVALPLQAQEPGVRLSGMLLTEGSGAPVEGAHVALVTLGDTILGETFSDERGAFSLSLPPPGVYYFRVGRIGYQSWASDTLHIASTSESRTLSFDVPVQPIPLAELLVSEEGVCPTTPDERKRAFDLYEAVLPILRSVSSTADIGALQMRLIRPVVAWRRGGLRYVRDTTTVYVEKSLHTASPEQLETYGYAEAVDDSTTTFYAPDGDALASPGFLATHCLRPIESGDGSRVGLGFEPKPGRTVVDVRGVLWIDESNRVPQELEFKYTSLRTFIRQHLEPAHRADVQSRYVRPRFHPLEIDESDFGGFLHFEPIVRNRWLIRRWKIVRPIIRHALLIRVNRGTTIWPRADTLGTYGEVLAILPGKG